MKKLATLAVILSVTACSATQGDSNPTSGGGNAPGTTSGGSDDGKKNDPAATPADKPGDKPGDAPAAPVRIGGVTLSQTSFKAGNTTINSYTAFAFFGETAAVTAAPGGTGCKTSTDGACSITECTAVAGPADAGAPADAGTPKAVKAPEAGDITVAASTNITLSPAADTGAYAPKTGQVELFASGADIDVKAAGSVVPAFDKKLSAPSLVTITSPAWPTAGTALDVDRTKPISLVWTGGTAGDVTAQMVTVASPQTSIVSCKFAAADGKGTIPASALGKLVATTSGSISITAASTLAFDQGDWKMTVSATSPAKAGASLASGTAKVH